jgi:hypothetical protein
MRAGNAIPRTGVAILVAAMAMLAGWGWVLSGPVHAAKAHRSKSSKAAKDFTYTVSDCLESERKDAVGLVVSDSAVSFNQILTMNCIAATRPGTVKVDYARKGRELEVSVVLRSVVMSDCTCPIEIDGTITRLGKGTYRIAFFFDAPSGTAGKEKAPRRALGMKEFSIE